MSDLERLVKEYMDLARRIVNEAVEDPLSWPYHEVAEAFLILRLGPEGVKRELLGLAREHGGCVSCRHSTVVPHHLSLTARFCRLGLRQDTCGRWEPL